MEKIDTTTWEKVKFGDEARSLNAAVRAPLAAGIERYVGLEHIEPNTLHLKSWGNVADGVTFTRTFRKGNVLFGKRRAYQRKAAVADFDGLCSGDILVLEAKADALLPALLPFLVHSDGFFDHAVRTSAGSLSPRTKFQDLAEYQFRLPPREQQARLAELLCAADEVLTSNEKMKGVLSDLKEAYLLQKFGDASGLAEHRLQDFARIKRGKFSHRPRNDSRFFDGNIPFVQTGDIVKATDGVITNYSQTLNELGLSVSKLFKTGTIVMTITGANTGEVAELGIDAAFPDSMVGIEPIQTKVSKNYLHLLLKTSKQKLVQNATKNTQENLNIDILNKISMRFHELDEQGEILAYVVELQKNLSGIEESSKTVRALSQSLINQIFSA